MKPFNLQNQLTSKFISIEGGEGSGKTTLIRRLHDYLKEQGSAVITTREPGGSALGEAVRQLLLHGNLAGKTDSIQIGTMAELLLFLAARAQHIEELIYPALKEGKIVICDRFNDSTVAYQGAARQMDLAQVETLCQMISANIQPSLTLFLDVDPRVGLMRANASRQSLDTMERENILFHDKVREAFQALARKHPERIVTIDAHASPEQVFSQALHALAPICHGSA